MTKQKYIIGETVSSSEVPNWARVQRKWGDITDRISKIQPGGSLTVIFESNKDTLKNASQLL